MCLFHVNGTHVYQKTDTKECVYSNSEQTQAISASKCFMVLDRQNNGNPNIASPQKICSTPLL